MIFEGEIGKGNLGGIAVDDISINNHISQEDCASEYTFDVKASGMHAQGKVLHLVRVRLKISVWASICEMHILV